MSLNTHLVYYGGLRCLANMVPDPDIKLMLLYLSDGDQLIVLDLEEELEPVDRRGGCSADGTSNSAGQQQLCRKRSASKI